MYKFTLKNESQALIIVALANLIFLKIFPSFAVSLFASCLFLLIGLYLLFFKKPKNMAPLFVLLVLGMDAMAIFAFCLFVILKYLTLIKKRKPTRAELIMLLLSSMMLIQALFIGGYLQYNVIRLVTVLVIPLFIVTFNFTIDDSKFDWFSMFLIIYFLNLIYITFLTNEPRTSIFWGSENIGLAIIFIFAVLAVSFSNKNLSFITVLLMYNVYALFFTQSRTSVIFVGFFSLFVFNTILCNKETRFSLGIRVSLLGALLILASYGVLLFLDSQLLYNLRLDNMLQYFEGGKVQLDSYSETDLRGMLTLEGLKYFLEKPIWGCGSVSSPLLLNLDYSVGKVVSFHNSFIDLLVQFGLFGTLLLLLIYYCSFIFLRTNEMFKSNKVALILVYSPIAVAAYFQPYFFNIRVMMLIGLFTLVFVAKKPGLPSRANRTVCG